MSKKPRTPHSSSRSNDHKENDFLVECQAAYLAIYDDLSDEIKSKSELQMVLQQTGRNPTQKSLDSHWGMDTRRLNFDDFCEICQREKVTSEDDLLRAFQRIDVNGDGFITYDELIKTMTQRGEKMSRDEVKRMISEVDDNKDGKLNYKEFSQLIMSTTNEVKKLARQKMEKLEARRTSSASSTSHREKPARSPRSAKQQLVDIVQNGASNVEVDTPQPPHDVIVDTPQAPHDVTVDTPKPTDDVIVDGEQNGVHESRNGSSSPVPASPKPQPRPRSANRNIANVPDEVPKPQPRPRRDERPKSPVASKKIRLPEPRALREWRCMMKKGVLHLDEDSSLSSHKYRLTLTENTDVWITVQPRPLHPDSESIKAPVDISVLILNDTTEKVVSLCELRDSKGKYCLRCDLQKGKYLLLPFSTGCRLRKRKSEPKSTTKLVKKDGDSYVLTRSFREALLEIFEMSDLDGNGLLSREEFNLYNLRTSGEPVQDEEWEVVEENIELKNGEITTRGFVQLNEMEAEDNEGDAGDLWVTLHSMGYNKSLVVDEACPFTVNVYVEDDDGARLDTIGFTQHKQMETALTHIILNKGDAVKMTKEVTLYVHSTDYMTGFVAENKSRSKETVRLDLSKSLNCVTNRDSLEAKLTVSPKSFSTPVYVMPQNERLEWTVRCKESLG